MKAIIISADYLHSVRFMKAILNCKLVACIKRIVMVIMIIIKIMITHTSLKMCFVLRIISLFSGSVKHVMMSLVIADFS